MLVVTTHSYPYQAKFCSVVDNLFIIHLIQKLNEQFEFVSPELNRNVKHDRLIPNFGPKY